MKLLERCFCTLTFFILFSSLVTGIGISPGKVTVDFSPNKVFEVEVLLVNSRDIPVGVEVTYSGVASERISAETPTIPARGSAKSVITFELPDDIPPGNNRHVVTFTETFFDPQKGGLAAKTAVNFPIYVWKPYPGKYADLVLTPEHVKEGFDTELKATIFSRGEEAISGDLEIRIESSDGELVSLLSKKDFNLEGDSSSNWFFQVKSSGWKPGVYSVRGEYDYGAGVATDETDLIIGEKNVRILDFTDEFNLDKEVNRFDVTVQSLWNDPIDFVSAKVVLGDQKGETPTITLAPFNKKTLTGYIPTDPKLVEGEHLVMVTVNFDDQQVSVPFTVKLVRNPPPEPELEEPASEEKVIYLVDVVALVLLLLALCYLGYQIYKNRHAHL